MIKRFSSLILLFKKPQALFLSLLILTILASHFLYVYKTYQFPQWDEVVYLQYATEFIPVLKNPTLNSWGEVLEIVKGRQPFYPLFISIPLLFVGTEYTYKIALIINGIFYSITIFSIYFLAKEFVNKKNAFLASYIFAFYGFPLFYLHFALQDTIVTSFIVLSLLFLTKLNNKFYLKYTFFFSIFLAMATLVRWTAPIFIIGGIFTLILLNIKKIHITNLKTKFLFKHLIIFILFGILPILMLYYVPNFSFFYNYVEVNISGGPNWADDPIKNSFSKSSIIWYANILAQQTIFFTMLFLLGLIIICLKIKKYKFLFLLFVIPYLTLTFGATWKEDRFISPVYPIMAIISVVFINEINNKIIKRLVVVTAIILGFLNFLGGSWGVGPMKFSIHGDRFTVPHSIVVPMPIGHPRRIWLAPISWPPRTNEGNVPLIIETITKDFDYQKHKKPTLLLAFDFAQVSDPIAVKASLENPALLNFSQLYAVENYEILFSKIKNADYLLTKTGRIYDEPRRGQKVIHMIQIFNDTFKNNNKIISSNFKPIKKIMIPIDKSELTIYKKEKDISNKDFINLAQNLQKADKEAKLEIQKIIENLK